MMRSAVKCAAAVRVPALRLNAQPQARLAVSRRQQQLRQKGFSVRAEAATAQSYGKAERGEPDSFEYRIFLQEKGQDISTWHDIPLYQEGGLLNFICEIPKETSAKMECATDEEKTPIKQDTKKGKLRFYPYNINVNYGMLPQTWEDPAHKAEELDGVAGDNDPVDVVEIGSETLVSGGVYPVKPLAVLAMIDDGELDWKVAAIKADDPKAASVNDVEDVEREFPGLLDDIRVWFRDYKKPDGKPENKFGFDDQWQNKVYTLKVISETHEFYKSLKSGKRENTEELSLA